jgi:acetyltransferase
MTRPSKADSDDSKPKKNLDPIFKPRSIAIIGASRERGTISHQILHNLLDFEFSGKVFPVNPKSDVVSSMKSYPSVLSIPDSIDLAIVVVPRDLVGGIVDECGKKNVKGLIIVTAGFSETGDEGRLLEERLRDKGLRYGMRIVGPNCMGVLNTDPRIRMNATFSATQPLRGKVGFMSQSGALGEAILAHSREINLGFSKFVSLGNKVDISGTDLLAAWKDDPSTSLILMYLESFGDSREFTRLARETTLKKPIIAAKAGRTRAGARAVASHTGSLAGLDVAADALFEQCGIIRVNSVEELFDLAQAFVLQPVPKGNRVAVLTNAGGPGIMATDAVESSNLTMARLSRKTRDELRVLLPSHASTRNPVDLLASAQHEHYAKALELLLNDSGVDAVIVIFVAAIVTNPLKVVKKITELSRKYSKTVLGCFMGRENIYKQWSAIGGKWIPIYLFPESAIGALSAMVKYRMWKERPSGKVKRFRIGREKASSILTKVREDNRNYLLQDEAFGVIEAYGINVPEYRIVRNATEAVKAARELGYPVVMKILSSSSIHKTDLGLVALGLRDDGAVKNAFKEIKENSLQTTEAKDYRGTLVQRMVMEGQETIVGMIYDPNFGPLMMFGLVLISTRKR